LASGKRDLRGVGACTLVLGGSGFTGGVLFLVEIAA